MPWVCCVFGYVLFDADHFFVPNNISNSRPFNFAALSRHYIVFLEEQTFEKLDQKNKTNNLTIPKRLWNFNPLEICFSCQTKYFARQNSGETILLIKENPFAAEKLVFPKPQKVRDIANMKVVSRPR